MNESMKRRKQHKLNEHGSSSCKTGEFPELNGITIFEANGWSKRGVECMCCNTVGIIEHKIVQLIRWGDDYAKTARFNYTVCPSCRKNHEALIRLFKSDRVKGILDIVPQSIVFGERAGDI